jgi:ribonucleoside-triphosphate reductase
MKEFWKLLDERLELCHKALLIGCKYLENTKSDVAPILWQDGALARLKPGETIDKFLKGGYSTTSLGYVGLFETMMALTGKPHTDPENQEKALEIVKYMQDKCEEWNAIPNENYGFSLYGTPEESLTYKFAKVLQSKHGVIKGITDKNYVINSYHWNVKDGVDAFTKLSTEAKFQKFTAGGAISYVETGPLANNIEAVLSVIRYIYDNIMYAELNCKLDYCQKCGYDGEITMVQNENNKLIWKCPNCGNTDLTSMNVMRRVCGYISNANLMNQGRMGDIHDRKLNLQ